MLLRSVRNKNCKNQNKFEIFNEGLLAKSDVHEVFSSFSRIRRKGEKPLNLRLDKKGVELI